jgi:hypothetical protein
LRWLWKCRLQIARALKLFGFKGEEVAGGWRKLLNEELHDLYSLSDIIRVIKLRRMRWAGHVECMGDKRDTYRGLWEKPKGMRLI